MLSEFLIKNEIVYNACQRVQNDLFMLEKILFFLFQNIAQTGR